MLVCLVMVIVFWEEVWRVVFWRVRLGVLGRVLLGAGRFRVEVAGRTGIDFWDFKGALLSDGFLDGVRWELCFLASSLFFLSCSLFYYSY